MNSKAAKKEEETSTEFLNTSFVEARGRAPTIFHNPEGLNNDEYFLQENTPIEVLETIAVLDNALAQPDNEQLVLYAYEKIQRVCKHSYLCKAKLGASGACSKILALFNNEIINFRGGVMTEALKTVSLLCLNEPKNKSILGSLGVCRSIVNAIRQNMNNVEIVRAGCTTMIDISNAKSVRALYAAVTRASYMKTAKARKSIREGSFVDPVSSSNELTEVPFFDNKRSLGEAGACELLCDMFRQYSPDLENKVGILTVICNCIACLSGDNLNCAKLCELGLPVDITMLLRCNDGSFQTTCSIHSVLSVAAIWVVINQCANAISGNKTAYGTAGAIPTIFSLMRRGANCIESEVLDIDSVDDKDLFDEQKNYQRLVEYSAWAIINLAIICPENVVLLRNIPDAKISLEEIMSNEGLKNGPKAKVTSLFNRLNLGK